MVKIFFGVVIFLLGISLPLVSSQPEPGFVKDKLVLNWGFHYNSLSPLLQKISALAYDPTAGTATIAWEPAMPMQANTLRLKLSPDRADLVNPTPLIFPGRSSQSSIQAIAIGPDGAYQAFGGRSGELVITKGGQPYKIVNLESRITDLAINSKNILAVGGADGRVLLVDLENRVVEQPIKLFAGKVTSLYFQDDRLFVAGVDSKVFRINSLSGEIEKTYETRSWREEVYRRIGLKPCHKPRIHKVAFVKEYGLVVTTHGWEYCKDFRVRIWEEDTGKLVNSIKISGSPIFQMEWIPEIRKMVLIDREQNLWKLSLDDFEVSSPINLRGVINSYDFREANGAEIPTPTDLGDVNALIHIPGRPYLIIAAGSYFKGGPRVVLAELKEDFLKITAMMVFNNRGFVGFFVSDELLKANSPLSPGN